MSYEGVSHHWTTPAFEDDSNMDVTLDLGGNEENSFLRPIPRSMMDGGDSARTFEDEDMIDLSPRPFLRQDMDGDDQVPDTLDLDQQETAQEPQPEAHDTNGSANDLDEITYDDDEENDDATPSGLDTAPTGTTDQDQNHDGPTDNITGDHPTQEEDREPDLIDYGDDDESEIPQVEATADDADPGENEYFDQHGNSHAENYPEAEVTHDGGADLNDAAHATVEHKESEEFQYDDSTYDNDGNHPSTQHTERSHHTEEQHQKYSSHPIIVDYYNQWISLFKGSISEVQDSFNIEEEVLYGNISLTFERMRQSSFVNIREWECLEVHVPALDLWIRERSDESDRYSFADLLNTYLDLHSRDGNYAPDPLFLTLSVRPIFRHQLEKLQGVAGSGGGFSKCDFLRSSQPNYDVSDGDSGESGEDNEQHSQQYEAHEERDDPAQSAISTVSPHPVDPSSATLTGQSNTPGELLTGEGEPSSREDLEAESDEDELGEQQYGHDAYDKNAFDGETYEEDGHEDDQHFNQEYDESAENQENSESLDPFQGNDQEYHQYEDETDQPAEDGGLEIYEGDHQDLEHGYNHDAEEQTADQTYEASKSDREPDRHGFENASTGQDGNDGLAYEDEGQEYLAAYDQSADHQYYDQEETFIGDDIAQEGFAEYDQSLHHESHDQIEGQYQSYGDHGQNGDLGGDHIDGSEAVEAEFLIDYSDTEEVPPQADGVEHALEKDQVNTKEDDISYSDDEDVSGKTPIKRPRADDDLEIEPKRLKAEAT